MVNVFMIDDHPVVIKGVESLFFREENRIRLVGSALNVTDALQEMPSHTVHVIMLDLYLGKGSPDENFELLRTDNPGIPIVIYSADDSFWWKSIMFRLGANAFVNKCEDPETLITTILQVANCSVLLPAEVKELVNPDADTVKKQALTWVEIEVGKEISHGRSIKEIAVKTGKSFSSIEKTLRIMREKTGTRSNPDLTRVLISQKLVPVLE